MGPCIDYSNKTHREQIFTLLKFYADKQNVLFLRIDPNVIRVPRDIKGNLLEGFINEHITNELIDMGYVHKGYGYAYNGFWTNRYTLMLNLSPGKEKIFNNFIPQRRRAIKRHKIWNVYTVKGNENDIPDLMRLENN